MNILCFVSNLKREEQMIGGGRLPSFHCWPVGPAEIFNLGSKGCPHEWDLQIFHFKGKIVGHHLK